MTTPDPTDEIRDLKQQLAAEFEFDIKRIAEETRRNQQKSNRKFVTLPPRRADAKPAG